MIFFALLPKTTKLKDEINDKITALTVNRTIGKRNAKPKEHLLVNEERWCLPASCEELSVFEVEIIENV